MTSGDMSWSSEDRRNLRTSMDTLFPDPGSHTCRVCGRKYDDGRRSYCSDRCKRVANAVAEMYNWKPVREQVLERDDHTCQNCGLSREMAVRAYWQSQEIFDDVTDDRVPDFPIGSFHVDHIEPVSDGGHPFEESNLQVLCEDCHAEKTAEENTLRNDPEERPEIGLQEYMEETP